MRRNSGTLFIAGALMLHANAVVAGPQEPAASTVPPAAADASSSAPDGGLSGATTAPASAVTSPGAGAQAQMATDEPFQVVRTGDAALTCEVMRADIETLSREVIALQTQVQAQVQANANLPGLSRSAGSAGMGVATTIASFVPGLNLVAGAAAFVHQQAEQAAMRRRQQEQVAAQAGMTATIAVIQAKAERAAHLSNLMTQKPC